MLSKFYLAKIFKTTHSYLISTTTKAKIITKIRIKIKKYIKDFFAFIFWSYCAKLFPYYITKICSISQTFLIC